MFGREKKVSVPFSWAELLSRRLAHYNGLSPALRARFDVQLQSILNRTRFYGCNGLQVTEEMQVLVAGIGALLVLRPDAQAYPDLRSILLYPTAFWVRHEEPDEDGLVYDEERLQLGESQDWGRIILSWEDVEAALDGADINVAAHEFAHQLDVGNGAPGLPDYSRWSVVMQAAFDALVAEGSTVLDDYGCEGPAEFFAVATEAYFQRGAELQRHHPPLYALLRDYYLFDPLVAPLSHPAARH